MQEGGFEVEKLRERETYLWLDVDVHGRDVAVEAWRNGPGHVQEFL